MCIRDSANSTGLAATAFAVAGRDDARAQALGYLDSLTFGCETPALAGAVAYNRADFDAAVAQGAQAAPDGTITRSTAQALMGRTDSSYVTVTSGAQTAATPALDCAAPPPGDDDSAGSGSDTGSGDAGSDDDATAQPEIPAVVQTDGAVSATPVWALGLGAGLGALVLTLAVRRRAAARVR